MRQLLLHPLHNCGKLDTRDAGVNTETQPPSLEVDCLDGRQVTHRHSRWAVYYKGEGQGGQERWPGGNDIEVETYKDDLAVSRVKEKPSETTVGMHISGRRNTHVNARENIASETSTEWDQRASYNGEASRGQICQGLSFPPTEELRGATDVGGGGLCGMSLCKRHRDKQ